MDPLCRCIDMGRAPKKNRGPQAVGRGRKGLGTAMHMAISTDSVVTCQLFPAQRQDCRSFFDVCRDWPWQAIKKVVGDKGYATGPVKDLIREKGAEPVIPPRGIWVPEGSTLTPEDCYDTVTYRQRHVIERLFGRIKENKRIAMRFDKLDQTFLSFIALSRAKAYQLFC